MPGYNNFFPATYQPYQYPQYQQMQNLQPTSMSVANQQTMTPPTIHAEIVQVDNRQAAANYPVGVGASQMMIARDDSAIYVKTATQNGYELAEYVRRPQEAQSASVEYITREEFEERIKALSGSRKAEENESV